MVDAGSSAAQVLVVSGPGESWQCAQSLEQITGPGPLRLAGAVVWESTHCQVGSLRDELALPQMLRCHQRSAQIHAELAGELPFGSQPIFHHQNLFGDRLVRVTTDLRLTSRSPLQQGVAIGSLVLRGPWRGLQEVTVDPSGRLALGALEPLTAARSWTMPPLALVLHHAGGGVLEIGLGNDWWRWRHGVVAAGNVGRFRLEPSTGETWRLEREVSHFTVDTAPEPRSYRFCWYVAWQSGPSAPPRPAPPRLQPAAWQANGKLDLRPLAELDGTTALVIDADAMAWPPTFMRTSGGPCHACHGVSGRLRQAVRQLKAMPNQAFPVFFRGLRPGTCTVGNHLDRPRELPHWDLGALLDFGHWTRHQLGPERALYNDCETLPLPSLRNLFQDELAGVAAQTTAG